MSHEHAQHLQGEAEAKEAVQPEQAPETAAAPSAIENPLFEESASKVGAEPPICFADHPFLDP